MAENYGLIVRLLNMQEYIDRVPYFYMQGPTNVGSGVGSAFIFMQ